MSRGYTQMTDALHAWVQEATGREADILARLRQATADHPQGGMQISPAAGQFIQLMVGLTGARRYLEVGTFTGYSALAAALALPDDGYLLACDVSEEFTSVGRPFWEEAGVDGKIDLRIAPALETLASIRPEQDGSFDLAFIDADKEPYSDYYDHALHLLRPGGVVMLDNVLWGGAIADPENTRRSTEAIREVNRMVGSDDRVDCSLLPLGDGILLARKR